MKKVHMINSHTELIDSFLDFRNDYLTIEKFAEHREISIDFAKALVAEGKRLNEMYYKLDNIEVK